MPIFNTRSPDLEAMGPVINLRLSVSDAASKAIFKAGGRPAPPVDVRALIDTGASRSIVQNGVVERLGLLPVGMLRMNTTAATGLACYEYLMHGSFHTLSFAGIFIGAPLEGPDIQALIGRDILAHFVFNYSGPDNSFTLYC